MNFSAAFTAGATLETWTDEPTGAKPSRLNISADREHKRRVGTTGVQIEVTATVAGVAAPLDAALDGQLFLGMFAEHPGTMPVLSSPAGQSSVQRFTPAMAGHYTFMLRRDSGGGIAMHLDVQDP